MSFQAPKEIYLNRGACSDEFDWEHGEGITWCAEQIDDSDIAYIRKDIYDVARDRIKELEEALMFYTDIDRLEIRTDEDGDYSIEEYYDDSLNYFGYGTTARSALYKD